MSNRIPSMPRMGHSAGGSVSMTLKSGTNEWHGSASWNHRNPKWNAIQDRTTGTNVSNRNNIGAATLGNPIIKNKLFNFFSFERWWLQTPGTVLTTVPTALEKQGDFSQSLNTKGELRVIYDPYTTVVDTAGRVTRTPFPGNKIPANRINPLAQKIMNTIWAPNRTPDSPIGHQQLYDQPPRRTGTIGTCRTAWIGLSTTSSGSTAVTAFSKPIRSCLTTTCMANEYYVE